MIQVNNISERSVPMPRAKKSKNKAKTGGKKKAAAGNK